MSPSLDSLEVEVLAIILEYVDDECPHTTKSVSLACRHLHSTSKLVSQRRRSLNFSAGEVPAAHEKIQKWLKQPVLLKGLRHLTVKAEGCWRFEAGCSRRTERWSPLVQLLQEVTNLRTLVWSLKEQVPLKVLEALHTCQPRAVLKVYDFSRARGSGDSMDSAEAALATSPAVVLLRMDTSRAKETSLHGDGATEGERWYGLQKAEATIWLAIFQSIVATAPHLHTVSAITPHMQHWDLTDRSALNALLGGTSTPNASVRSLTVDGFGYSKATLEHWARVIDLSRLESLKCSRGTPRVDYFTTASTTLPRLKQVSLNLRDDQYVRDELPQLRAAVEEYLRSCAPLAMLSLWSWMGLVSLDTILDRHGTTLTKLHLHEREEADMPNTYRKCHRSVLTVDQMAAIRMKCPQLTELTMDVNRQSPQLDDESNNLLIYHELAHFPHLNRVQLYLDLGVNGTTPLRPCEHRWNYAHPPWFTPANSPEIDRHARTIWKHIYGGRPIATGARRLDIKMGEWERRHGPVGWEADMKSWWVLTPHERDDRDRAGQVMVKVYGRPPAVNDARYPDTADERERAVAGARHDDD